MNWKRYLRLPSHTKYGWLVYLMLLVIPVWFVGYFDLQVGIIASMIFWAISIAFVIEVFTKLIGKNKVE